MIFVQEIWKLVWFPCSRSLGKLSSSFVLRNVTWILLAVTLTSLRGSHQSWFFPQEVPTMVDFSLRDFSLCFTDPGFCVSDGFEARDSETCLLHTPSPLSSALTFSSWKHPGGLSRSSQGIWKSNYTALRENTENYKNTSVIRSEVTAGSVRVWILPINFPFRALFVTFLILN